MQFGDQDKEGYVWESFLHSAWKEMVWWPAGDPQWVLTNYIPREIQQKWGVKWQNPPFYTLIWSSLQTAIPATSTR